MSKFKYLHCRGNTFWIKGVISGHNWWTSFVLVINSKILLASLIFRIKLAVWLTTHCCCSVLLFNNHTVFVQSLSCVHLCDPMDCRTPGFPVLHYLLEFAQTHVHWVGDAIQLSHPLSPPSPSIFPSIKVFSNELALHIRWPKYWSFSFTYNF